MAERVYHAHGAAAKLFACHHPEVLIEGPAGTGKTRAVCEKIHWFAQNYPGSRYLLFRKTRASMSESVLVTWEDDVMPLGHAAMANAPSRPHRHSYRYPNRSEVVVAGMDNPDRIMSTQFDIVAGFEATELNQRDWEKVQTRLRNHRIPHPDKKRYDSTYLEQGIADCNPASKFHWLNQRADGTRMMRLHSRHEDNPSVTEEYLSKLRNLTGVLRKRLYQGLWVAAEGQIWENFDPDVHIIKADMTRDAHGKWHLWVPAWMQDITILWTFATIDWGYRAPGVLQVWGVDAKERVFLLREIYRVQRDLEWWADRAEYLRTRFDIARFVCDPSRPENIARFNVRLGRAGGYHAAQELDIAGGANNAREAGLSVARERLANRTVFFLDQALEEPDAELRSAKKPVCTVQEIPNYLYRQDIDGRPIKDEPAPDSDDHGCDAFRYGMMFLDVNDWRPAPEPKKYPAGSYGHLMGHEEVFSHYDD